MYNLVLGMQWGDEGKGKIISYLAEKNDYIIRGIGGSNAGHTAYDEKGKHAFHLLPSSAINENKLSLIGPNVVLDPLIVIGEINRLLNMGYRLNLKIDKNVHIVMPYHIALDIAEEEYKSKLSGEDIGTTKRGIGPCYEDVANRSNEIRLIDLFEKERLRGKLKTILPVKMKLLEAYGKKVDKSEERWMDEIVESYTKCGKELQKYSADVIDILDKADEEGKRILVEGVHGFGLSVLFGTAPYVTSSDTTLGGSISALAINPKSVREVVGVVKAYATRVGKGPFPTKLDKESEEGKFLQAKGDEFGTTTGRPRDTGWLDLVLLRHAVKYNKPTQIAFTKFDVLEGLDEIGEKKVKICYAYELNGKRTNEFPTDIKKLEGAKPVCKKFDAWGEQNWKKIRRDIYGMDESAWGVLTYVAHDLKVPITMLGIGPKREDLIKVRKRKRWNSFLP